MSASDADELIGPYGTARRIPRAAYRVGNPAALDGWIITAPRWHPVWSQYLLGLVTLADFPGAPPAILQRPGVTHELTVLALNPEFGPYAPHSVVPGSLHFLTPVNIAEQVTTTDDQARRLAELCVRAVVDGVLIPETGDAPQRIRAAWSSSIRQTLEHPHHGHAH